MMILKNIDGTDYWAVYPSDATKYLVLNTTAAQVDATGPWNDTAPTASVFTVGAFGATNSNNEDFIAYCFHSVEGYSQVGGYTGNANADGTFVYTGFEPKWLMVKPLDGGGHWAIFDAVRYPYNIIRNKLYANSNTGVITPESILDFTANGFKMRNTDSTWNGSYSYIYVAMAENPFKTSNAR